MSNINYTMDSLWNKVTRDLLQQKENILMEQLNDFVSRGLIVIEETQPIMVREEDRTDNEYKIKLCQSVRLVLKDKEYIEKLEAENKELKEKLSNIMKALTDLKDLRND